MMWDQELTWLMLGILGILVLASLITWLVGKRELSPGGRAAWANIVQRIKAWWMMAGIFGLSVASGGVGSVVLFAFVSFLALREFITLTPTRRADHATLFWSFFVILPIQYYLVGVQWYGFFSVFIPVYAFLFIPIRGILAGDPTNFLARSAKIQFGLMISVYCVSHAPALMLLDIKDYFGENGKLLLFFVLVDQLNDVFQFLWGKALGRHPIAPKISPNKTWEGFLGGLATATALGAALWWCTPFTPKEAAALSATIAVLGFFGDLTLSAIKRDRGVKDYGGLLAGHGGILDRIDSLCFAAPVFFHLVRYLHT